MEIENPTAQVDLSLYLRERAGRLIGYFEYAADLFERATIERMAGHFQILLANIVEHSACGAPPSGTAALGIKARLKFVLADANAASC